MIHQVDIGKLDEDHHRFRGQGENPHPAWKNPDSVCDVEVTAEQHFGLRVFDDAHGQTWVVVREGGQTSEPVRMQQFVRMATDGRVPTMQTTEHGKHPLRSWLDQQGKTVEQVATEWGLSAGYLYQITAGWRRAGLRYCMRIHEETGIPIQVLANVPLNPVMQRRASVPIQAKQAISANDIRSRILPIPGAVFSAIPADASTLRVVFPPSEEVHELRINRDRRYLGGVTDLYRRRGMVGDDGSAHPKMSSWTLVPGQPLVTVELAGLEP